MIVMAVVRGGWDESRECDEDCWNTSVVNDGSGHKGAVRRTEGDEE